MEKCTANILASIDTGTTTIEECQQYCKRLSARTAANIDEYQYETYTGAREALSLIAQRQTIATLTDEQLLALRDKTLESSPLSHPEDDEITGDIEAEMIRRFEA